MFQIYCLVTVGNRVKTQSYLYGTVSMARPSCHNINKESLSPAIRYNVNNESFQGEVIMVTLSGDVD